MSGTTARLTVPSTNIKVNIRVVVHEAEEGGFWGEALDELLARMREAIDGLSVDPMKP